MQRFIRFFLMFSYLFVASCIDAITNRLVLPRIITGQDIRAFMPSSIQQVQALQKAACEDSVRVMRVITDRKATDRTFANTIGEYSYYLAAFKAYQMRIWLAEYMSSDMQFRHACQKALTLLHHHMIDQIVYNPAWYRAFQEFKHTNKQKLSETELYTLEKMDLEFKQNGLDKSPHIQDILKKLKKKLKVLLHKFNHNIVHAVPRLVFEKHELTGLSSHFINSCEKVHNNYIIYLDGSTYRQMIERCTRESTRKKLWHAMVNRAYPENISPLKHIIQVRSKIAYYTGFDSFDSLDIASQMAKTPKRVELFLDRMQRACNAKVSQEVKLLQKYSTGKLLFNTTGHINPWDMPYAEHLYKQKALKMDPAHISEYFPLEHTLQQLCAIYKNFFGITFHEIQLPVAWQSHVKIIAAHRNNQFLGYILLDLFSEQKQYVQPRKVLLVPSCLYKNIYYPAFMLIQLNLAKSPTGTILLQQIELTRIAHEFGHAIHGLLGCTNLPTNSGTAVTRDFAEAPAKLLEEFIWEPHFLKKLSRHYKTNKPLPDTILNNLKIVHESDLGRFVQKQIYDARLALGLFSKKTNSDIALLSEQLFTDTITYAPYYSDYHGYASFQHLGAYGAKFYSYLWSKAIALDIFEHIKRTGFSAQEGDRLIVTILSKGGSLPPEKLLMEFLHRKPQLSAFYQKLKVPSRNS